MVVNGTRKQSQEGRRKKYQRKTHPLSKFKKKLLTKAKTKNLKRKQMQ